MPDKKLELRVEVKGSKLEWIIQELRRLAWSWQLMASVAKTGQARYIYSTHAARLGDIISRYAPGEDDLTITRVDSPNDLTTKNNNRVEKTGKNRKKITCSKKRG